MVVAKTSNGDGGNSALVVLGCGWNEHGNLGVGDEQDRSQLSAVTGAPIVAPSGYDRLLLGAGGGHFFVCGVSHDDK